MARLPQLPHTRAASVATGEREIGQQCVDGGYALTPRGARKLLAGLHSPVQTSQPWCSMFDHSGVPLAPDSTGGPRDTRPIRAPNRRGAWSMARCGAPILASRHCFKTNELFRYGDERVSTRKDANGCAAPIASHDDVAAPLIHTPHLNAVGAQRILDYLMRTLRGDTRGHPAALSLFNLG